MLSQLRNKILNIFAKLSFNFNFNLVESWDGYILIWSNHPPPSPPEKFGKARTETTELDQL